ncbi:hypothetical protein LINGRAPRIM_LOCUS2612 [Linum grandiflorum]
MVCSQPTLMVIFSPSPHGCLLWSLNYHALVSPYSLKLNLNYIILMLLRFKNAGYLPKTMNLVLLLLPNCLIYIGLCTSLSRIFFCPDPMSSLL